MTCDDVLNRKYMPYVSRARAHGGPTLFKAIGPALLTKDWQANSQEIKQLIVQRFGAKIAVDAAAREVKHFATGHDSRRAILERFKEIYDQATA